MATSTTTIRGVIRSVSHAASSRNGNPTYRITLDDGMSYLTETDGSIGYGATNFRPHSARGSHYVELTMHGQRIVDIRGIEFRPVP